MRGRPWVWGRFQAHSCTDSTEKPGGMITLGVKLRVAASGMLRFRVEGIWGLRLREHSAPAWPGVASSILHTGQS